MGQSENSRAIWADLRRKPGVLPLDGADAPVRQIAPLVKAGEKRPGAEVVEEEAVDCVATVGDTLVLSERLRALPRFCRLAEFGSIPGLFPVGKEPSRRTLAKWYDEGFFVTVWMGTTEMVDIHMTFKKNNIRTGILRG